MLKNKKHFNKLKKKKRVLLNGLIRISKTIIVEFVDGLAIATFIKA